MTCRSNFCACALFGVLLYIGGGGACPHIILLVGALPHKIRSNRTIRWNAHTPPPVCNNIMLKQTVVHMIPIWVQDLEDLTNIRCSFDELLLFFQEAHVPVLVGQGKVE